MTWQTGMLRQAWLGLFGIFVSCSCQTQEELQVDAADCHISFQFMATQPPVSLLPSKNIPKQDASARPNLKALKQPLTPSAFGKVCGFKYLKIIEHRD